jgi:hypothetical protein
MNATPITLPEKSAVQSESRHATGIVIGDKLMVLGPIDRLGGMAEILDPTTFAFAGIANLHQELAHHGRTSTARS